MENQVDKKQKLLFVFLILALMAYVIKNIFVGADVDEGYGVMIGFRLAMGDKLLLEMWEPHQTSAIFTALFIKPFLWITGGNVDFLNVYLRVLYFAIHGMISWGIYRSFLACKKELDKNGAAGLALVFFVCSPKSVFIPEYSNLHIWFFALLCISLMWYFCAQSPFRGRLWILAVAGIWLTCDVLAYPSMALLLPFCLIVFGFQKRNPFWKECLIFIAPCVVGAGIFMGYVFSYMSLGQLLKVLPYVLGDGSHSQGLANKLLGYAANFGVMGLQLIACGVVAVVVTMVSGHMKDKGKETSEAKQGEAGKVEPGNVEVNVHGNPRLTEGFVSIFLVVFFVVHIVFMFFTWFTHTYNASYTRLLYLAIALTGVYCYQKTGKKEKAGLYLILLSVVNYCAVLALSNWNPSLLAPYFIMGALGGLLCWNRYFHQAEFKLGKAVLPVLCGILTVSCCFGYCFRIIGGELTPSTIFEIQGINRDGFRKGILANYMTAYRYNSNQDIWAEAVPKGSTVMYVGMSQFSYMHGGCVVAVPSTISTPTYDEAMLAYWEMNPDRYPDVVVVESCYGDIGALAEDAFLMEWLEEEFGAAEIIDYPYMRVYRR